MIVSRAGVRDAGEILTLQRAAYVTEAQLYGDPFLAPLVEPPEQVRALLEDGDAVVLKAVDGARVIGAVRARVQGETCLVGRLVVAPDRQGEGVGGALMKAVEAEVAGRATALVLFTGHLSEGNLRLYRRLGYAEFRRERVSDHLVLVHLRKPLG
ncbi:GNAT family N-acetyltransferase [Actinocorallia aurantiaca]|uniref:GNAT family N-acetyltransferase n=1 Tax=Actinocorallia aurantiaca TaxID=46204 RepID=A0ABN3UJW5_9ACTN